MIEAIQEKNIILLVVFNEKQKIQQHLETTNYFLNSTCRFQVKRLKMNLLLFSLKVYHFFDFINYNSRF